jgi:Arc/MetJ family transcription regulator
MCVMPTNLSIDDALLEEALRMGGHTTKRDTVNEALQEYVNRRKRQSALELIGKVEFDRRFDYKKARRRR